MHRRPAGERNLLNLVRTGSAWARDRLYHAGPVASQACPRCGVPQQTVAHIIWECPGYVSIRKEVHSEFGENGKLFLHKALMLGIAPKMTAAQGTTYWGTEFTFLQENTRKLAGM